MFTRLSILSLLPALIHLSQVVGEKHKHVTRFSQQALILDLIPFGTRAYWMRRANAALAELESPCPFAPFGTVIVNHTDTSADPKGKLVCYSVNQNYQVGNPTLHGEFNLEWKFEQ